VSISPTIYEQLLRHNPFTKKLQTQIVSTKKLRKMLLYEKAARKILVKLTQGWKRPARDKHKLILPIHRKYVLLKLPFVLW
jgi:hypothetical protein